MSRLEEISENVTINSWAKHFLSAPCRINKSHETDAELLEHPGDPNNYLAVTIDTVAEEITEGLYRDPYTMGWVTIMACFSDLAAVGADPLGLVISVSIEPERDEAFVDSIAQGMEQACRTLGVFILGGDTNQSPTPSLTGCALGLVPRKNFTTRLGCRTGDAVFISGKAGAGNALGLVKLARLPNSLFPEERYRPVARLSTGHFLRKYAHCCMDTSDGLLTTLDQLMRLNHLGFIVDCAWERILQSDVLTVCNKTATPPWTMIAGPHGEFELLWTIPENRIDEFVIQAKSEGFNPICIGSVQSMPMISLDLPSGKRITIDMAPIRNLLQKVEGDPGRYLGEFRAIGKKWGVE